MKLVGDRQADVVVLGAGIAGGAVALELSRRRRRVAVIEAVATDVGEGDLGHVSMGTGSPYSEVVRSRGGATALRIWEAHRENHERLRSFLVGGGDDCGYRQAGGFLVAEDRAAAAALADSEDALRDDGFSGEFLDHYMFEARFDITGFAGAYWAGDEAEVDVGRLRRRLEGAAAERGVVFFEPSPLLDLDLSARGAEVVTARGRIMAKEAVLALETVSPGLVPVLSNRLVPLEARGLARALPPGQTLPTPARVVGGEVGWQWRPGELRLAGAGDLEGMARRLGAARDGQTTSRGPAAGSVDGLPFIGLLPGLPVATAWGYGRLALAYSLVGARWAAEALVTGRDPAPAPFRADRPIPRAD